MAHPKLDQIEKELKKGRDFSITRGEYIKMTGKDIPQRKSYTEKESAVAKKAESYGYKISVIPETLIFTKVDR